MNNRILQGLFCAAMGLFWSCDQNDRIAGGTNDETHTEAAARFLEAGGRNAAVGAVVQVVPHDSVSAVAIGVTDDSGRPVVAGLRDGLYTLAVAKSGYVAFVDSVPVIAGRIVLASDDTLGLAGSLSGVVKMQPDHDPATVVVNVLGTEIWTNVESDGGFRLDGLGAGRYRLRFLTTLHDYTTTYVVGTAVDGAASSLSDTVRMVYTGIPVVVGLSVRNDTLDGDQILSWKPVAYRSLQGYIVYRDTIDALAPSRTRFATVSDTFWRDTSASRGLTVAKWKYRVAVETMTGDTGKWFGFVAGASVPRVLSGLDKGAWTEVGRSWGGDLYDLNGRMTEIDTLRDAYSFHVGIRSSADGLLWDSVGYALPLAKSGFKLQWIVGAGAGRIWALGHSLRGDVINIHSSADGRAWTADSIADSLWPSLAGRLSWIGTPARAGIESQSGAAALLSGGTWGHADLPPGILGATDSAVYAKGGGSHLLGLSWSDRSRILSDEGVPPFVPDVVVRWNGSFAALSAGRLWIRDPGGWTLRRRGGLNRLASFGDRLLVSDSTGVLSTFQETP